MIDQKDVLKSGFSRRSQAGDEQTGHWKGAESKDKKFRYFGIELGNKFVRRFKVLLRDGRVISIPYAHLPVFIYTPEQDLKIKTSDVEISITGRSLHKLETYLSEEKVLWIKESASGIDEEDSDIFIENIGVDGDLLI